MSETVEIVVLEEGVRLRLIGRLDARNAPAVREQLHAAVDAGDGELVLALGDLEIWDGTGLGVLVGAGRRARNAGRALLLTEVSPRVARLLRVARVHRTACIEPADADAAARSDTAA